MIPQFPEFKKIELSDKYEVEKINKKFQPHSDFNFTSIWSWDVEESVQISMLGRNLILSMADYTDAHRIYSFLGRTQVTSTIHSLLDYLKHNTDDCSLKLISEEIITKLTKKDPHFEIVEDRDNFDYILSVGELATLQGSNFSRKRTMVSTFLKKYEDKLSIRELNTSSQETEQLFMTLFDQWAAIRNKSGSDILREKQAISRLFLLAKYFRPQCLGIFYDGEPIALSIYEHVHKNHALFHFEKYNTSYTGIAEFLRNVTARTLSDHGICYINFEQDLGIEGLRYSKSSYKPVSFHKKFIINYQEESSMSRATYPASKFQFLGSIA